MSGEWGSYWCECGHGWNWHADYEDESGRYLTHPCDYYSGCKCKRFTVAAKLGERSE